MSNCFSFYIIVELIVKQLSFYIDISIFHFFIAATEKLDHLETKN